MMKVTRRTAVRALAGMVPAVCIAEAMGAAPANPAAGPVSPIPEPAVGAPSTATKAANRPLPPAPTPILAPPGFGVAEGPFQPNLESLSAFQVPEWYRDAKLGLWAHWGPQCQPEMGDWYAQHMYQPSHAAYKFHVEKYGHPSKFGFKDVINEWKAENWDPAHLIGLYKKAGAKFFAAMANHHDNLDMWDSTYQPWNTVRVGPKKDIIAGWAKATRAAGLRFAVTCHGDRSWSWMQVAQGSDPSGPMAGVPYDGRMTKADGIGKWWEGLDPQDLYAQYHEVGKYDWPQNGNPPIDKAFVEKFFNRTIDLINQHNPDLLYFDDTVMPIYPTSDIGLRIAAYYYNMNMKRNGGKLEAVMTGKGLNAAQRKALLLDVERGVTGGGETLPWQTDTCIGSWHYQKSVFDQHKYKTAEQVVQMLIDIVSKNGTLMLSIPLKGDGTPDADELKVIAGLTSWMEPNAEGIHGTRPWEVYGEGPSVTTTAPRGQFGGARDVRAYTSEDVRFTKKGETVYAFVMGWPRDGKVTIKTLGKGSEKFPKAVGKVELLGAGEVRFEQVEAGLVVTMPERKPNEYAYGLKVTPV